MMRMIPYKKRTLFRIFAQLFSGLCACGIAHGQSGGPSSNADENVENDVVVLSPFAVSAEQDTGYRATATLSGTRINTSLRDIATSIQAITPEFLEDTGITNITELLQYTTGTEVSGGAGGNFYGGSGNLSLAAGTTDADNIRRTESSITRVRGLAAASTSRGLFPSVIPFNSYNISRIEINRGANSVLFGLGSPAGIVNYNVNEAKWRNANKVELRVDEYGSHRQVLDLNRVLIHNKLAFRVIGLNEETRYKQEPSFRDDRRYFLAASFRPFASTSITASFEKGWIDSTLPRVETPRDYLTHFSTTGSHTVPINTDYRDLPPNSSFIQFDSGSAGRLMIFDGPTADNASYALYQWPDTVFGRGVVNPAAVNPARVNDFRFRQYAMQNGREIIAARFGDPRGQDAAPLSLVDPSVFDFFNNNIDGTASYQWGNLEALNVALRQEILDGRAGIELAYDTQTYDSGYVEALDGIRGHALMIDVSESEFAYAEPGSPASGFSLNPNFLRPFVGSRGAFADRLKKNETLRATAFLRHDFFEHSKTWLGRLLGQHTLTGVGFRYTEDNQALSGFPAILAQDNLLALGLPTNQTTAAANSLGYVFYLGDSLAGQDTTTGLNIPRYSGAANFPDQVNINYVDSGSRQIRTASVGVLNLDNSPIDRLARGANMGRDTLDTVAAVLQSFWWDGAFVSTFGWRRDKVEQYTAAPFPTRPDGTRIFDPSAFDTSVLEPNEGERDTTSYSGVLRVNKLIGKWMPRGVELDLHYGWSENYQGLDGVRSVEGGFFDAPIGETKEMGFSMDLLDNKLFFRANWFETVQKNLLDAGVTESIDTITGGIPDDPSGGIYRRQTLAQLNAAGFEWPPGVIEAFGIVIGPPDENGYADYSRTYAGRDVQSVESKGFEFETTYNITRNWRLTANVAKVESVASERGLNWADTVAWVKENWFDNPAIAALDVGLGGTLATLGGWEPRAITSFQNVQEAEGASNPNIRKWRANLVTNYTFSKASRFNGFGVGGAVRFQDEIFLGYEGKVNPADPSGALIDDVTRPIMGPTETNYDVWISYQRMITDKILMRLQLNVRNLFAGDDLTPIRSKGADIYAQYPQFDHYASAGYMIYRIAEPRTVSFRAAFEF